MRAAWVLSAPNDMGPKIFSCSSYVQICHPWTRAMKNEGVTAAKPLERSEKPTGMLRVFLSTYSCHPCTRVTQNTAAVFSQPNR